MSAGRREHAPASAHFLHWGTRSAPRGEAAGGDAPPPAAGGEAAPSDECRRCDIDSTCRGHDAAGASVRIGCFDNTIGTFRRGGACERAAGAETLKCV